MFTNVMRDRFNPGTDLTAVATVTVTGKTFLSYAGPMNNSLITVAPATAGQNTAGVAKYDANADDLVGVARGSGRIVTVTAGAALTAGTGVEVGEGGKAIPATTGTIVGWAVDNATADTDALISLAH